MKWKVSHVDYENVLRDHKDNKREKAFILLCPESTVARSKRLDIGYQNHKDVLQ